MASLKRLGARVIAPVSVVNATAQAGFFIVALLGGGAILGFAISPSAGIYAALGGLLLLSLFAGWGLQREIDAAQEAEPNVEFAEAWAKREFLGRGTTEGEWADIVGVYVRNIGGADARNLWAEIEFRPAGGEPFSIMARWSQNPQAQLSEPFEAPRFTQVTLPANERPEPLDVAVRFEDGAVFGLNTRNLFSRGRHDIFALGTDGFQVRIRVKGESGIQLEGLWRCEGDSFELVPVSSD